MARHAYMETAVSDKFLHTLSQRQESLHELSTQSGLGEKGE